MRPALLLCLYAGSAAAQTAMTPDEFEAWSTGRTLDYSVQGQILGSEAYFPERRVMDADTGGPCRSGHWFPREETVCFVYQGLPGEHCWRFWRQGDKVLAQPLTANPADPQQEVTPAASPLACPGPDVGA